MDESEKQQLAAARKHLISVTIRTDLINEARGLHSDISRAAEAGIEAAVKKAKEDAWLTENKAAIEAHNERIARSGALIKPKWLSE